MKGTGSRERPHRDRSGRIIHSQAILYGLVWTSIQVMTLDRFPFVHSDEAWLSGLSLTMLRARSFLVTEPFFDVFPRQAHAFKILFHALQSGFIQLFGYQLKSIRLISLMAAMACLVMLHVHADRLFSDKKAALGFTILFSLQIQFLYASHLARQEILLLLVLILAGFLYDRSTAGRFWVMPLMIGLSAMLHPNAFIIAMMIGLVVLKDAWRKRIPRNRLLLYTGILLSCMVALTSVSLAMTPDFLTNYARYGSTFGMDTGLISRWQGFLAYFIKLFQQISGSYWLPDIRFWLILGGVVTLVSIAALLLAGRRIGMETRNGLENGLCGMGGFLMATFIIGRYNPTAILFAFYPILLLTGHLLNALWQSRSQWLRGTAIAAAGGLIAFSLVGSIQTIRPFTMKVTDPYELYLAEIRGHLPQDAIVLGNLSAGFALMDVPFYDIRNLDHVANLNGQDNNVPSTSISDPDKQMTTASDIEAYLQKNEINTVIWYEEYDYIIRNPMWRILYEEQSDSTAPSDMLMALKQVVEERGDLLHTFESKVYGTRIARFMDDYPWQISLYRIQP